MLDFWLSARVGPTDAAPFPTCQSEIWHASLAHPSLAEPVCIVRRGEGWLVTNHGNLHFMLALYEQYNVQGVNILPA